MAGKFRGITWNNARFGPKIQVRRSIDLAELGDLGNITDEARDLPTSGAVHREDKGGSKSGTREYTDFRTISGQYSNVVDTQDMGLISETASTHRVWSSTGAITDVVTEAPTTLGNPSSDSSDSSSAGASGTTTYTGSGTFEWTVPTGVTSISAVAVGAGSGAYTAWNYELNRVRAASGGRGGSLSYSNNISVTPGEVLTVHAGAGGDSRTQFTSNYGNYTPSATAGESSYIARSDGTVILRAKGASAWGYTDGTNNDSNIGDTSHEGGSGGSTPSAMNGGPGGGGAAGYAGAGGNGRVENNYGTAPSTNPVANSGAASGGYGGGSKTSNGKGGGGVGLYGLTNTGSGNGSGGSGGTNYDGFNGGTFGGGAAGGSGAGSGQGGPGGVRIIWNSGSSFPSTNVGESDVDGKEAIFGTPEEE